MRPLRLLLKLVPKSRPIIVRFFFFKPLAHLTTKYKNKQYDFVHFHAFVSVVFIVRERTEDTFLQC